MGIITVKCADCGNEIEIDEKDKKWKKLCKPCWSKAEAMKRDLKENPPKPEPVSEPEQTALTPEMKVEEEVVEVPYKSDCKMMSVIRESPEELEEEYNKFGKEEEIVCCQVFLQGTKWIMFIYYKA